jgi:hypothetical protein
MTHRIRLLQSLSLLALVTVAVAAPVSCVDPNANPNAPPGSVSGQPNGYPPPQPGYPQPAAYPQPGYPQAGYPQAQPGYPPQPAGYPGQAPMPGQPPPGPGAPAASASNGPLGPVVTSDPNQLSAIFAQAAQAAQAFLQPPGSGGGSGGGSGASGGGGGMPTSLADGCIKLLATQNAQGMSAEGQEATGNLQEGGHLAFMVPMQGGKCYTLIGCSPPGQIKNVDLNLLAPPFYNVLAGQDTTDDNHPIIGSNGKPMCPIVPVALNYKVDIVARSGSGTVAVQLYSKSK